MAHSKQSLNNQKAILDEAIQLANKVKRVKNKQDELEQKRLALTNKCWRKLDKLSAYYLELHDEKIKKQIKQKL